MAATGQGIPFSSLSITSLNLLSPYWDEVDYKTDLRQVLLLFYNSFIRVGHFEPVHGE